MAQFRQLTVVTATVHRQPPRKTQPHHPAATSHQHPHGLWPAPSLTLRRPLSRPSARSPPKPVMLSCQRISSPPPFGAYEQHMLSSHFRVDTHQWPHDGCWLSLLLGWLQNMSCRRTLELLLPGSLFCAHDQHMFISHPRISCGRGGNRPTRCIAVPHTLAQTPQLERQGGNRPL